MWKLVSERGDSCPLPPNKIVTVGRKVGDLVLAGDQSVSREHAFLEVKLLPKNGVVLWDSKSKFGTFIYAGREEPTKISPSEKVFLKEGDKVRFGLQHNTWILVFEHPPCVCTSNLSADEKRNLVNLLEHIGGKLSDKWTEQCSHLTMSMVSITIKAVSSLACGKPIVMPSFWQDYKDAICSKKKLPNIADYIPPLADSLISKRKEMILPNTLRKFLFKDKMFVFSSERQLQKYGCIVEFAGGRGIDISTVKSFEELCKPNYIVIQHPGLESEMPSSFKNVTKELQKKNLRAVPDTAICHAILDVSVEKFCNPSHNPNGIFRGVDVSVSKSETGLGAVIAVNTEEISSASQMKRSNAKHSANIVIPPTCSSSKNTGIEASLSFQRNSCRKRSRESTNESKDAEDSCTELGSATMDTSFLRDSTCMSEENERLVHVGNDAIFSSKHAKSSPKSYTNTTFDDFILPSSKSSKRRKVTEASNNSDDADMFNLPSKPIVPPTQKVEDKDMFEFDDSASSQRKNNLTRTSMDESLASSRDLFEESVDIFDSLKTSLKRKADNEEPDIDHFAAKKLFKNTETLVDPVLLNDFLSKSNPPLIKQEVIDNEIDSDAAQIVEDLRDKMVVETVSLIFRPVKQAGDGLSPIQTSKKNFKKFAKVWKRPIKRVVMNCVGLQKENFGENAAFAFGPEEDEEEADAPSRLVPRNAQSDEEDEWAFRPLSQM